MLIGRFGLRAGVMSDLRSRSIRLTVRVTRFGSENRTTGWAFASTPSLSF